MTVKCVCLCTCFGGSFFFHFLVNIVFNHNRWSWRLEAAFRHLPHTFCGINAQVSILKEIQKIYINFVKSCPQSDHQSSFYGASLTNYQFWKSTASASLLKKTLLCCPRWNFFSIKKKENYSIDKGSIFPFITRFYFYLFIYLFLKELLFKIGLTDWFDASSIKKSNLFFIEV